MAVVLSAPVTMYVGEDVTFPDTIFESDGVTLQIITGWAVQCVISGAGGAALVVKSVANGGITLTTPSAGLLTVTLASADTAGLGPGDYGLRIERTDPGFAAVLTKGTLKLLSRT